MGIGEGDGAVLTARGSAKVIMCDPQNRIEFFLHILKVGHVTGYCQAGVVAEGV